MGRIQDMHDVQPHPVQAEIIGWFPNVRDWDGFDQKKWKLTTIGDEPRMCTTTEGFAGRSFMGAVLYAHVQRGEKEERPFILTTLDKRCLQKVPLLTGGHAYRAFNLGGHLSPTQEDPGMALKIMKKFGGEHHLMPLLHFSEGEENCYALTDYKGLGNLLGYVRVIVGGPMPEGLAKHIFLQVLEATLCLHSNGVCHRAIALENVLLSNNIARPTATLHGFGMAACTPVTGVPDGPHHFLVDKPGIPGYRAPELFQSNYFNGIYCDLYSLGVLLYAMVAGDLHTSHQSGGLRMTTETGDLAERFVVHLRNQGKPPGSDLYEFIKMLVQWNPTDRVPNRGYILPSLAVLDHRWLRDQHQIPVDKFRRQAQHVTLIR